MYVYWYEITVLHKHCTPRIPYWLILHIWPAGQTELRLCLHTHIDFHVTTLYNVEMCRCGYIQISWYKYMFIWMATYTTLFLPWNLLFIWPHKLIWYERGANWFITSKVYSFVYFVLFCLSITLSRVCSFRICFVLGFVEPRRPGLLNRILPKPPSYLPPVDPVYWIVFHRNPLLIYLPFPP